MAFNRTYVQESLFRQIVYLAVQNHLEPFDVSSMETITPGTPVNCSATANGLKGIAARGGHGSPSDGLHPKVHPYQDRDNILKFLVALQNLFHTLCCFVVFFAHNQRIQNTRRRFQRVYSRIDTQPVILRLNTVVASRWAKGGSRSRVG